MEKILKALYVDIKKELAPHTHNLLLLAEKTGCIDKCSDTQLELLELLNPLNVEARYPTFKKELMKSLSKEKCSEILEETKEFQRWVKKKLEH